MLFRKFPETFERCALDTRNRQNNCVYSAVNVLSYDNEDIQLSLDSETGIRGIKILEVSTSGVLSNSNVRVFMETAC